MRGPFKIQDLPIAVLTQNIETHDMVKDQPEEGLVWICLECFVPLHSLMSLEAQDSFGPLSQPAQKISEQFISLCNLWRNLGEQLMNPFSP